MRRIFLMVLFTAVILAVTACAEEVYNPPGEFRLPFPPSEEGYSEGANSENENIESGISEEQPGQNVYEGEDNQYPYVPNSYEGEEYGASEDDEDPLAGLLANMDADLVVAWIDGSGSSVNMRAAPSTDADVLFTLNSGQPVELLHSDDEWARVRINDQTGYVNLQFIRTQTVVAADNDEPRTSAWISGTSVNLRKGPSRDTESLETLLFSQEVFLTGEAGEWKRVALANGTEGYVFAEFVSMERLP